MIRVRVERPGDAAAVRAVERAAFGRDEEADLVDALRGPTARYRSWVAVENGDVVGHVLFTPVSIDGWPVAGMGLGPVAVAPERQRLGIGTNLVQRAMSRLRAEGCPYAVVVGHPDYYPRFGFVPGARFDLEAQWPGLPEGVFRVRAFAPRRLPPGGGIVRFRPEFDAAM